MTSPRKALALCLVAAWACGGGDSGCSNISGPGLDNLPGPLPNGNSVVASVTWEGTLPDSVNRVELKFTRSGKPRAERTILLGSCEPPSPNCQSTSAGYGPRDVARVTVTVTAVPRTCVCQDPVSQTVEFDGTADPGGTLPGCCAERHVAFHIVCPPADSAGAL